MVRSLADRTFQLRWLLQRPPRWLSLPAIHLVGLRSWRVISSSRSNAFFYLASAISLCAKRLHGRNFWWVWRWPVGSRCCSQKSQWCFLKCMRKSRSIKVNEFSVDWQSPRIFAVALLRLIFLCEAWHIDNFSLFYPFRCCTDARWGSSRSTCPLLWFLSFVTVRFRQLN